ncbi:helix-turn-helix domain-containing protein [Streptomyces sp. NBC_01485]|uniref:helix-turn-helix domain-containing protein n=1 Tax=Streptomyces sp. NBC_01485 TaxID=2903884 RepID=UPI003FCE1B32
MSEPCITFREAAQRLGVHENTIRNWANRGILATVTLPTGRRKVNSADVERLEQQMFDVPRRMENPNSIPVLPTAHLRRPDADVYPQV